MVSLQMLCASVDCAFSFLPTAPIIHAMRGTKRMVNSVSCHEMTTSVVKYAMMRIGFLNSMSRLDITLYSISCTSPDMRAMMSPLRSSEKKPSGSDVILA